MSVFTNPASGSVEQARAYTAALLELLGPRNPAGVLTETPAALRQALVGLSESQMMKPEASGKWSVRQVMQHLADSDLVFGYRLRMVVAHDRPALTGYDQDLWAERLRYDESNVHLALGDFEVLRRSNLRLIARLSDDDRKRVGVHAERGEESVGHMIRMYAGHDLLHLNQLGRIRRAVAG
jgi:hypothetical protein